MDIWIFYQCIMTKLLKLTSDFQKVFRAVWRILELKDIITNFNFIAWRGQKRPATVGISWIRTSMKTWTHNFTLIESQSHATDIQKNRIPSG